MVIWVLGNQTSREIINCQVVLGTGRGISRMFYSLFVTDTIQLPQSINIDNCLFETNESDGDGISNFISFSLHLNVHTTKTKHACFY